MLEFDIGDDGEESTPHQAEMGFQHELEIRRIAAVLLRAVWNGIDHEYLSKYRAEIWRQFEERTATAARMTNSLVAFVSKLSAFFQIAEIGKDDAERHFVADILAGRYGNSGEILSAMRRDPQVCVLLMRIQKDEEKVNVNQ